MKEKEKQNQTRYAYDFTPVLIPSHAQIHRTVTQIGFYCFLLRNAFVLNI